METAPRRLPAAFWYANLALLCIGVALVILYAPIDKSMGPAQKIFYLHLPAAMSTFLASLVVCIASIGSIWQRRAVWDDLADAAARVTVVFCSVVLLTGMLWAHSAWGHWWAWSPRLTFSLILWILYIGYLIVRPLIHSPERRMIVSAMYGIVSFLDVPLVYLSVKLLRDIHPSAVELEPAMRNTVAFWFVPVTMICVGLIWAQFRLNARRRILERPEPPPDLAPGYRSGVGSRA